MWDGSSPVRGPRQADPLRQAAVVASWGGHVCVCALGVAGSDCSWTWGLLFGGAMRIFWN